MLIKFVEAFKGLSQLLALDETTTGGVLQKVVLNPKKTGFSKNASSKERVKPCFFNIINHIFPENFLEIPQVVQKIGIFSQPILAIFIDFYRSFFFFFTFLCTKKLMMSAYNR